MVRDTIRFARAWPVVPDPVAAVVVGPRSSSSGRVADRTACGTTRCAGRERGPASARRVLRFARAGSGRDVLRHPNQGPRSNRRLAYRWPREPAGRRSAARARSGASSLLHRVKQTSAGEEAGFSESVTDNYDRSHDVNGCGDDAGKQQAVGAPDARCFSPVAPKLMLEPKNVSGSDSFANTSLVASSRQSSLYRVEIGFVDRELRLVALICTAQEAGPSASFRPSSGERLPYSEQ